MFKPARVFLEGCSEDHLTASYDFDGKPIVHLFRSQQSYATVVMLPVIPGEEGLAKATAILYGAEPFRELRTIL